MESRIIMGALAGVVGGLVSGLFLQQAWLSSPAALFMGKTAIQAEWMNHLVLSLAFGMFLGLFLGSISLDWPRGALVGAIFGLCLWLACVYAKIPTVLMYKESLPGYLLLGTVTGPAYFFVKHRAGFH